MPEGAQFRIGAEVRCAGGEVCGEIRYLDVSRDSHTLTHLAVEERGRAGLGRLVPVDDDHVRVDPKTHQIEFLGAMAHFKALAGVLTAPDAANAASRRVLEKNGFELVAVRPVATEPTDAPMAIYRLAAL